jgi:SAM-dependent methyltransferase
VFTESAEYYDLIYTGIRNYKSDAATLADLLASLNPACRTILDVACGTGEHARELAAHGFHVDGIDLNAAFVSIARGKNPHGRFLTADMRDFRIPRRYDAILCLFSSIGYLETLARITQALTRFREHLAPGGVVLVEPWLAPGVIDPARVTEHDAEGPGIRIRRVSRIEIEDRVSRIHFDYEFTDATGTRRASEVHSMGVFSVDEMRSAFRDAHLDVEYDPEGLMGRGMYIARIPE